MSLPFRAVLFDVGGPLDTDIEHERLIDADIRAGLAAEAIAVDDASYAHAWRNAVDTFAPNAYRAIIWTLTRADTERADRVWRFVSTRADARDVHALRPGAAALLRRLAGAGVKLGLAANQPESAIAWLTREGLAPCFAYFQVSGTTGLRKPDARVFLAACEALAVAPRDCVMVGDRIDIDIAPARALSMTTIRLRVGRHVGQQPRTWEEVPDHDVADMAALESVLSDLCALP